MFNKKLPVVLETQKKKKKKAEITNSHKLVTPQFHNEKYARLGKNFKTEEAQRSLFS
jgi:hypothetical protein